MDRIDRQHSITLYAYLYISAIHIILCIEAGVNYWIWSIQKYSNLSIIWEQTICPRVFPLHSPPKEMREISRPMKNKDGDLQPMRGRVPGMAVDLINAD